MSLLASHMCCTVTAAGMRPHSSPSVTRFLETRGVVLGKIHMKSSVLISTDDCSVTAAGMRPTNSSPVVTRLLEAHGVVLGKTHMEELAEGLTTINPAFGPVLNPYNNLYDVGGE